jgi:AraC family transcriptional regulator, transcriptional activator of pobA
MKAIKHLPILKISNFDDYNHCEHCSNTFYIRSFSTHLKENTFLDKPHGHDFYIVLFITKGTGVHYIDSKAYDVKPGMLFFLAPGQIHNWNLSDDVDGYILFFTKEYLLVDFNNNTLAKLPFFFNPMNEPYLMLDREGKTEITETFTKIDFEYQQKRKFFHDMIRLHLKILLIDLDRRHNNNSQHLLHLMKYQDNQIRRLEALIDEYYKECKSVSKYADMMSVSIKQLNTLCKKTLGKTPGDLIQERIILEAKRLLVHSDYPVSYIAEELNYCDTSYFIRLFKKATHQTPEQFRASNSFQQITWSTNAKY